MPGFVDLRLAREFSSFGRDAFGISAILLLELVGRLAQAPSDASDVGVKQQRGAAPIRWPACRIAVAASFDPS